MPFRLTNAPASFQALINDTLKEYLDEYVVAYLDDILIFSKTYEEYMEHVKKVLKKLEEKELYVKLKKCEFYKHEIRFLGYMISQDGIGPDPEKIRAIKEWPEPETVKDVQSFVGLANFYRRLIKGFSKIAILLTNLTKKAINFEFNKDYQQSFRELKQRLIMAPILKI